MNIKNLQNDLAKALKLAATGKRIDACRLFFMVARLARKCRAKCRFQVAHSAGYGLSLTIKQIFDESNDATERSEAGRIKVEAMAYYSTLAEQ